MAKRIFLVFISICLLIGMVPFASYAKPETFVKNGLFSSGEEMTDIYHYRNIFYLPSTIDVKNVHIETSADQYSYNGKSYTSFPADHVIDLTPGQKTDEYGNTCYRLFLSPGEEYTFYSGSSIGIVYVSTSGGINNLRNNKNYRDKNTKLVISDENGKVVYDDISNKTVSEIKGRGNASFSNEKKPFQIKLAKKTDLFGMGKAKTWILLANYNDASYIRNTCAFKIADALALPYTPKSVFVDLYIDNEYQGVYQLCEKTQIGDNRIEITDLEDLNEKANKDTNLDDLPTSTKGRMNGVDSSNLSWYKYASGMKNPDDITGGYLIELDNLYSGREKCTFATNNGNTYTVKSPEVSSEQEMGYIANLFCDFEQALYSETGYNSKGKYYTDYCDLASLVKVYLVEELTKNWDAYVGSVYFYKDSDSASDKLYAGPVWDFDNTWGNIRGRLTFETDKEELWAIGTNVWYKSDFGAAVMQHEDAKALASKLYSVAASCLETMLDENGYIDELTTTLEKSAAMDMARWPINRRNSTFIYFNTYSDGTVNSAVGYLRDFMTVRTAALYAALGAEHSARHDHEMIKTDAVEPTCEQSGTGEYWTCSGCGKIFADEAGENEIEAPEEIAALGHDWGEWTVTKEATEDEEGVETRVCQRDGTHTETRSIPKKEPQSTGSATELTAEPTTEAATSSGGGCGSFIGETGMVICVVAVGAALALKKKKKER